MSNYPSGIDDGTTLPNPTSGQFTNNPDHAVLHSTENDAIKALEAKLGTGSSTAIAATLLRGTGTGTTAFAQANLTTDITGTLPVGNGGTGITSLGTGVATFLGTPTSANLASALTDETGSGALVFSTSPALVTPTGIVKGDVGLGNVDNTSDATKNAAAVTLTNKTLTGPVINQFGTASGLGAAWQSWTPSWTNLSVGNGTIQSNVYTQVGKTVFFTLELLFGNTTSVSGTITFSLPITASTSLSLPVATVSYTNGSGTTYSGIGEFAASTTLLRLRVYNGSATYVTADVTSATAPFSWVTSSQISISGTYQAA